MQYLSVRKTAKDFHSYILVSFLEGKAILTDGIVTCKGRVISCSCRRFLSGLAVRDVFRIWNELIAPRCRHKLKSCFSSKI